MQRSLPVLIAIALLACACARTASGTKFAWFQQLKGWQKLFGILAVIAAVFILLSPDFLALGLLGDSALFDALVLLLSLQFQTFVFSGWYYVTEFFRSAGAFSAKALRRLGIPSPGFSYVLYVSSCLIIQVISVTQKFLNRKGIL